MFKKKELLIILILAVLALMITAASGIFLWEEILCPPPPYPYGIKHIFCYPRVSPGFPLRWVTVTGKASYINLIADFLFWFAILAVGWWVIKKLKIKNKK